MFFLDLSIFTLYVSLVYLFILLSDPRSMFLNKYVTVLLTLVYMNLSLIKFNGVFVFNVYLIFLFITICSIYFLAKCYRIKSELYASSLVFFCIIYSALLFAIENTVIFFLTVEFLSLLLTYFVIFSSNSLLENKNTLLSFLLLSMCYFITLTCFYYYLSAGYNTFSAELLFILNASYDWVLILFIYTLLSIKLGLGPLVFWSRLIYKTLNLQTLFFYTLFNFIIVVSHLFLIKFFIVASPYIHILLLSLFITLLLVSSKPKHPSDIFLISFYTFTTFIVVLF